MERKLFIPNNPVNEARLRAYTRQRMEQNELIVRCADGDPRAVQILHDGLWTPHPYIKDFGNRVNAFDIPLKELSRRFGAVQTREVIRDMTGAIARIGDEENDHALLWHGSAREAGFNIDHPSNLELDSVKRLIEGTKTKEPHKRSAILFSTEQVAEETSAFLKDKPKFNKLFKESGYWPWGREHTDDHFGTPHHLIYLDFAVALNPKKEQNEPMESVIYRARPLVENIALMNVSNHEAAFHELLANEEEILYYAKTA